MTGTHSDPEEPQPRHVNPVAIIAGALASISAAVVASYFGVAGTLIGTAVVSIISSLGAAVYAGLLGATAGRVQRTTVVHRVSSVVKQPRWAQGAQARTQEGGPTAADGPTTADGPTAPDGAAPSGDPTAPGAPGGPVGQGDALAEGDGPAGGPPAPGRAAGGQAPGPQGSPGPGWRRWLVIGGVALVIFAIAIGVLTGIEAAIKEPLASALGVRDRGQASTSVGVAVHRASGSSASPTSGPSTSSAVAPPFGGSQPGQAPPTTQPLGPTTTPPPSTSPSTTQQPSTPTTTGVTPSTRR